MKQLAPRASLLLEAVESVRAIPRIRPRFPRPRLLDIAKVREQQPHLSFWTMLRRAAEEYHRRLSRFAQSQKCAEVGIGSDYNPVFPLGAIENSRVGSSLHSVVAHVRGIMSCVAQTFSDKRRKRIIDEKSQETERSGNSRSRTASAAKRRASSTSLAFRSG